MKEERSIRFGVISLDYPDWRTCIDAAASYGLPLVEIYIDRDFSPRDAENLREHARAKDVDIHSVSCVAKLALAEATLEDELALIDRCMDVASIASAPFVTFMYGGSETLSPWFCQQRFLRRVAPVLSRAERLGLQVLIENVFSRVHGGDLDTADRTLALFAALGRASVGLNFDVGNFAVAGEEAFPYAFEALLPFIRSLHLKDIARYWPSRDEDRLSGRPMLDHSRGLFLSVPLGVGCLNTEGILRRLASMPVQLPVMLEPSCQGPARDEWMRASLEYIDKVSG
jgi:sugar phosphate isomerase/epimerase